jgi:hypothetical protein
MTSPAQSRCLRKAQSFAPQNSQSSASGVVTGRGAPGRAARKEDEGPVEELGLPNESRASHLYRDGELVLADDHLRLRKGDEIVVVTHGKHLAALRDRWVPTAGGRMH